MDKKIENYLEEIKENRIQSLKTLALDVGYFEYILKKQDENQLRDELEKEKSKLVKSSTGNVVQDGRDVEKINGLEKQINRITKMRQDKENYETMYSDIMAYVMFLDMVDDNTIKRLEIVQKIDEKK